VNFKHIETFFWVAKLRSFSKTAEQQFTTQPAISSRIAAFERELDVKLFDREGNNTVRLTPKGRELLPYAEKILSLSKELANTANKSASFSGLLRIGVSETVAYSWFPVFMDLFQKKIPDVAIELTVDVTANLSQNLSEGSLDIAFLVGPLSNSGMENEHLTSVSLVWMASSDLDVDQKSLSSLVSKYPVITYAKNTQPYIEILTHLNKSSDCSPRIFASTSLDICRKLVAEGTGIAALPREVVKKEIKSGKVQILDLEWRPSDLVFTATYTLSPHRPQLRTVVDLAREAIKLEL